MATLTLKNVPEKLIKLLRKRASEERRSLNQEVIHLLEVLVAEAESSHVKASAARQVEAWRRIAGKWKSKKPAREEIAEIYSARTMGRGVHL